MMDFEVHVLIENDGNVEKAEGSVKELDGVSILCIFILLACRSFCMR